jgi:hypothetical protein
MPLLRKDIKQHLNGPLSITMGRSKEEVDRLGTTNVVYEQFGFTATYCGEAPGRHAYVLAPYSLEKKWRDKESRGVGGNAALACRACFLNKEAFLGGRVPSMLERRAYEVVQACFPVECMVMEWVPRGCKKSVDGRQHVGMVEEDAAFDSHLMREGWSCVRLRAHDTPQWDACIKHAKALMLKGYASWVLCSSRIHIP